jgi:hypothetical protein
VTILAPTDAAFNMIMATNPEMVEITIDAELATRTLLYHGERLHAVMGIVIMKILHQMRHGRQDNHANNHADELQILQV